MYNLVNCGMNKDNDQKGRTNENNSITTKKNKMNRYSDQN